MTPQELKNSILQLAIQGRLVEQRPEEGTAEELYRQIQREKAALVKAGKIKKEKPLPEITEEEVPFEISEGWKWVRIGTAFSVIMGQSPDGNSVSENDNGIEFHQGKIHFSKVIINHSPHTTSSPTKIAPANSLLLCVRAPVGKVNITDREICIGRGLAAIVCYAGVSTYFAFYWMQTLESVFVKKSTGTTFKAISADVINNQVIPLPPLAEQKRIVAKIEELLPYIDRYEKAWSRLEDFNRRFPTDMQKSILQLAIQGKLVPQRPEEGTGEALYQQIQAEKQSLIRSGKLKKEKPLPEITDEEILFEIPENWMWARIGDLFNVGTGMTPLKSESRFYANGTIPWVNSALTRQRYIENVDTRITEYALANTSLTVYPPHTIIVAMYGQGKTRGQTSELLIPATVNQACAALGNNLENQDFINYVYYYYQYNYEILRKKAEGTSQPNLNLQKIKDMIIPLPPLAEQKRIVTKLEELLPLCERLK